MILWKNQPAKDNAPFVGNPYSMFPLGQISPPNPTPTDPPEGRTTWMWNPYPGFLPGAVPVVSPENPTPIVPVIGNRIGAQVPLINGTYPSRSAWLPTGMTLS